MAYPWEKYATSAAGKPWEKYGGNAPAEQAEDPKDSDGSLTPSGRSLPSGYEFVGQASDGGDIYRKPDGMLGYVGPVTSFGGQEDQDTIKAMLEGADAPQAIKSRMQGQVDKSTIAQAPVSARLSKFVQGYPFVGQYVDEAIGLVNEKAMQGTRAVQGAMDREYPGQSTALQIAGGVTGGAGLVAGAGPTLVANAPATLTGQVAAGTVVGGTTGTVEGAVSGYGAGNDGDRAASARSGAAIGGGFGAVFGGMAPAASRGLSTLIGSLKKTDVGIIAKTFGISPKAAEILKGDLAALDMSSARRNIAAAGSDAMLADAGISTREALDAAITGGGKAARIGTDAVAKRAAAAGGRLSRVMDAVLGAPEGIKGIAKSVAARTAPIRQKAYDAAYSAAINYADDAGRNIEAVLGRIPNNTLKSAISEANDAMKAAGAKNMQIMAEIAPDGAVVFREMPNVRQLDEIKKALGVVGREVDQLGRPTAAATRANRLARELKEAISEAVPVYKRAVGLGGDKIAEDNALMLGRKLFSPATTREMAQETMRGASLEAQEAARRGIRSYIDDTMARVRRSIDDPSIDTTETQKLLGNLSSRDAREKLTIVLGKPKADRLFAEIDMAGKQLATRQAIATGSATGRREARSRAIDDAMAEGVVGSAASGEIKLTAKSIVQLVTRETPQVKLARRQEVLAEVAAALTQKRGPDARAALVIIEKAISGQPIKSEEAARLGRLLAGSGALLADRTATQFLENRLGAR